MPALAIFVSLTQARAPGKRKHQPRNCLRQIGLFREKARGQPGRRMCGSSN
ncbi:hypothetical protein LEMLEM_LOCUS26174 [Lemmus lemmus]